MKSSDGRAVASSSERPIRCASSLASGACSCTPKARMAARCVSTVANASVRSPSLSSARGWTAPGRAAYQSMPSSDSRICGSASRLAGPSPRRRRITDRSWPATACSGSPRTPRGRTPKRVVRIKVGRSPIGAAGCCLRQYNRSRIRRVYVLGKVFPPGLRKATAPDASTRTMGVAKTVDRRSGSRIDRAAPRAVSRPFSRIATLSA